MMGESERPGQLRGADLRHGPREVRRPGLRHVKCPCVMREEELLHLPWLHVHPSWLLHRAQAQGKT